MAVRWRWAAARVVVLAGLVSSVGAAGLAGASGSHPARRGGVPEVWPVAPPRGVVVPAGELDRLRASAAGSGREVEVGQLRSGASRTFVARDGSLVRRFSAFAGVPAGELAWGAGGSGALAKLAVGGASLELGVDAGTFAGWGPVALGSPAFEGLTARYAGVVGGVDVKAAPDAEGFAQQIVIAKRPTGPLSFRFPLRLVGLHARMGAKGLVEFLDAAGRVVLRGSPGRAAGAQTDTLTGEPIKTAPVNSRLVTTAGGGQALEVAADPAFVRDASVQYPVSIAAGAIGLAAPAGLSRSAGARRSGSAGARRSGSAGPRRSGSAPAARSLASPSSPCSGLDCPPTNVVASAFNEKLDVTWGPPDGGFGQDSYTVSVYRASDGVLVASKTQYDYYSPELALAFTFRDGIVNGESYYAGVSASNFVGDTQSAYSATVTPAAVPWAATDTLGGANQSEPQVTCRSSWGVDCGTGNFSWSHSDLSVPGRGIALGLKTTYNSQSRFITQQDPGRWRTNYDMHVEFRAGVNGKPNAAIVHQENGSTVYFFDDGRGGWHAEGGAQATLVNNPRLDETTIPTLTFRRTHALTSFEFDVSGVLLSESDRNGYTTTLSYDASGHLARVTDPAGRSLSFETNAQGMITRATDPAGRQVSFVYDATGYLVTRLTDAAGGVTTFSYAPEPDPARPKYHLVRIVRPNGYAQSNAYEGAALASETGGPQDRTMLYAYDTPAPDTGGTPSTSTTTITDPKGNVVVARHTNYLLTSLTRGSGSAQAATSSFTHDPVAMRPTSTTDPRGSVWRSTYDAGANLLTGSDPLGHTTTYTYDAQNQPRTETDPLGVTTTHSYDANSNLTSTSRPLTGTPDTQRTTYAYDPAHPGDLTSMTDPNGKTWGYAYDASGQRSSQTDPLGDKQTFGYDPVGRLTSSVSPRGNASGANPDDYTTTYGYDPLDDLKSITDPLGHTTSLDYDPNRNLIGRTDANGHKTSYAYDRFDEPVMVTRPDGSTLATDYDKAGNPATQTDPAGKTTTYGYDALNRRTSETDPLGRTRTYGYDTTSNRTSLTDPAGQTTTNGYDDANRRTSVAYSDNRTPGVAYGYDADGQRTSMSDGTGQSSYAYDSLHRLTTHSDGAGHTVTYGYDLNNHPTAIGYPPGLGGGGGTVTRGYDDAGRLASVADWLGNTTQFGYDPNSQLSTQTYPNGASATQAYDNADRLTNISDTSPAAGQFLNLAYGRDPAGLLTSEGTKTFGYDQNNRLQGQSAAPAVSYGYDPADNPTSATVAGGPPTAMDYDAAHQLTTMTTGASGVDGSPPTTATYAYDPNGNRTSDGITPGAYSYDQANRLTGYLTSTTYAYDGDGLRTSKTGLTGAEPYTWDTAAPLPEIIGDASTAYITGPGGLPLEQITSSGDVHYYHQDQLGSTRAITDQTGNVAATSTYDPYGNPVSQTGTLTNPFGYAGQYTDPETGLQYLRARYYDPQTQNFLTRDPLTPTTRTPYTYTNNSPTNNTDPTGLDCAGTGQGDGSGGGSVGPGPGEPPGIAPASLVGVVASGVEIVGTGIGCLTVETGAGAAICIGGLAGGSVGLGASLADTRSAVVNGASAASGATIAVAGCLGVQSGVGAFSCLTGLLGVAGSVPDTFKK